MMSAKKSEAFVEILQQASNDELMMVLVALRYKLRDLSNAETFQKMSFLAHLADDVEGLAEEVEKKRKERLSDIKRRTEWLQQLATEISNCIHRNSPEGYEPILKKTINFFSFHTVFES